MKINWQLIKMIKEKFQLDWTSFSQNAATAFSSSFNDPTLADVTLVTDDGSVSLLAHKFVLGSASPILKQFFASNSSIHHPCLFMFGLTTNVLNSIMEFIYRGETVVASSDLDSFMMTARRLELCLNDDQDITEVTNKVPNQSNNTENKQMSEKDGKKYLNECGDSQTSLKISKDTRIIDLKIQTNNPAHKNPKQKRIIQVKKLDEFICTLCDKKFEYKSTLRNHNILKHGYIVC